MYVELDGAARLRNLARTARALPYDQRSYHLFEHRDLAHEAGADPDALQAFDPTDEALDAVLARTAPPAERPAQLASFGGPDVTPPGPPRGQGGGWMYPQPAAPKPPSQSEILLHQEVTAPADVAKSRDRFAPGYDTVLKGDEPVSRDLPGFIRGWEGSRSTAYDDGLGNMTIGTGHLVSGRNTFAGGITPEQDAALLNRNIADAQALVRRRVKAPLNQYQFDALTSLAMNVPSVFTRLDKSNQPSALLSALNNSEPNYRKAAEAFPNYDSGLNHKTGKQERLNGLARRRMAEAYLFLTGNYVSDH